MKRILFIIFLSFTFPSLGKEVNRINAKIAGYNFLLSKGVAVLQNELQLVLTVGNPDERLYVFSGKACFVIVSADDAVMPVLAYSTDDRFVADDLPEHISFVLDNYKEQIDDAVIHHITPPPEVALQWDRLMIASPSFPMHRSTAVEPLLSSKWSQVKYYNDLCPEDINACSTCNGRVHAGCVAIAMAQLMKYWQWPDSGMGTHTYTSPYGMLWADFSNVYDWQQMPDSLSTANNEVARLVYHAGVSVEMEYSANGSGAYTESAVSALSRYFRYDATTKTEVIRRPGPVGDSTWLSTIKNELDQQRPIMYVGWGSSGHAWLADGYDSENFVHMNWGWGGTANGYYSVDKLTPGSKNYDEYQHMYIGLQPDRRVIYSSGHFLSANDILLFPNPNKGKFTLSVPDPHANVDILVYDVFGKLVHYQQEPAGKKFMIGVEVHLPQGLYFVNVISNNERYQEKIIIGE